MRTRSGGSRFEQLQAGAVLFPYFTYRHNGAAQRRQPTQFLLDVLEPFMPLPVSHHVHGSIGFAQPILLVQLMDLSNLRPQTPDFFLEDSQMIHLVRIYQFSGERRLG